MGHVGPTSKEKEKKNKMMKFKTNGMMEDGQPEAKDLFFCFYSIVFLSQILEFLSVRIRRDKHGKCSTRRGLRVSTRNTRFHQVFR